LVTQHSNSSQNPGGKRWNAMFPNCSSSILHLRIWLWSFSPRSAETFPRLLVKKFRQIPRTFNSELRAPVRKSMYAKLSKQDFSLRLNHARCAWRSPRPLRIFVRRIAHDLRSEEHTSELQSLAY